MDGLLLKQLEYISKAVGLSADYTQGGGGNTSVKLDDELMAVKASGFKLKQVTADDGYVIVNYKNIRNYYEQVDLVENKDFEKESSEFVKKNIVGPVRQKPLRPSVEAGFHSILKRFVIHTHSVYANILCCMRDGQKLVEKIFGNKDLSFIWIPYINPGFCLTVKINEEISKCMAATGRFPQVVFMENHGLIVTADDSDECVRLHEKVNDDIRQYLSIHEAFPEIELVCIDENTCAGKTKYIADFLKCHKITADFFDENVIYPDQLVYLNGSAGVDSTDKKLNINSRSGEIIYKTGVSEARTIEETLLAYTYVLWNIKKNGFMLKTMSRNEIDFIRNWESEAYRKSLAAEPAK